MLKSEYNFPHIGNNYVRLDKIGSTNDWAVASIKKQNLPHGTVIIANNQHTGKGQGNNIWYTLPGQNITMSIILYPILTPIQQYFLNKITCIAIVQVIQKHITSSPVIKWPNDIYLHDRKIAGILIQNGIMGKHWQYSVVGIGLNVNQITFPSELNAISLKQITNIHFDLDELIKDLVNRMEVGYQHLLNHHWPMINATYNKYLYGKDQLNQFVRNDGQTFYGKILSVNDLGMLEIQIKHKIHQFAHKEVKMLKP